MPDRHVDPALQQAIRFHQAGQLEQAAGIYRDILGCAPTHLEALQLLGVLELQRGRFEHAIESLRRAVEVNSASADAWRNLGIAFAQTGKPIEAIESLQRALALH